MLDTTMYLTIAALMPRIGVLPVLILIANHQMEVEWIDVRVAKFSSEAPNARRGIAFSHVTGNGSVRSVRGNILGQESHKKLTTARDQDS
jgi:hypothetical protein